jgi:hypothetical protein
MKTLRALNRPYAARTVATVAPITPTWPDRTSTGTSYRCIEPGFGTLRTYKSWQSLFWHGGTHELERELASSRGRTARCCGGAAAREHGGDEARVLPSEEGVRLAQKLQVGHAFRWEDGYKRLKLAQFLGQLGVFLTCG